jgi:hypothetical protein
MKQFYIVLAILTINYNVNAQCLINSTGGYDVQVSITPTNIIPSSSNCPSGYNYNVTFDYIITVSGVNTSFDGNIGVQPNIFCNGGQNNGFFTINVQAPSVGSAISTTTYSGTLTTTTNQFRSASDCATATPSSLNCNTIDIIIFGPGISNQTVACNNMVYLPIELTNFDVSHDDKNVYINWETASEINNDYFTIERANDDTEWNEIIRVNGAGNSTHTISYSSTDNNPLVGLSYYRLKQVDYDGKYSYSAIKAINIEQDTTELVIYPNPTNGKVTLQANKQELEGIKIYSLLGQDVTNKTFRLLTSDGNVVIDLSNLPSDFYIFKSKTTYKKVFKR